MERKTRNEAIDRNQNILDHFHLISSSPLIRGATLGGVLRLSMNVSEVMTLPFQSIPYKIEMKPT